MCQIRLIRVFFKKLLSLVQFAFYFREFGFFDFINLCGGLRSMVCLELTFRGCADETIDIAKEAIQQVSHTEKYQKSYHRRLRFALSNVR